MTPKNSARDSRTTHNTSRMVAANDLNPDDEIEVQGERKQIIAVQVIQATGRVRIVLDDDRDFQVPRTKCFPLIKSYHR